MPPGDRQLRRLLAQAISAHKGDDPKRAQKLLDAAIEHIAKTPAPAVQQQQQIQPPKKEED
jgi:hypothetical protein